MRLLLLGLLGVSAFAQASDFEKADTILRALKLKPGELVVIPRDPGYFDNMIEILDMQIKRAGAVSVMTEYSLKGQPRQGASFRELLSNADVFLWLPFRTALREITPEETRDIARWTDMGGTHRQVHFHWDQGSVEADGLPGQHTPRLDAMYGSALKIDYKALAARQEKAAKLLSSGPVRVTTSEGTDIRFEIRDRPFNRQNGDATAFRMQNAKVRVDREIELPAGVLRVAPVEETASGTIVMPEARFGTQVVKGLRVEFKDGKVSSMIASEGLAAVQIELQKAGGAALRFREFGLGFNPRLIPRQGRILPYFAYGAGMVRMSLGDNEELGGAIRAGGFRRWFFFPNATVTVGKRTLVRDGKLLP